MKFLGFRPRLDVMKGMKFILMEKEPSNPNAIKSKKLFPKESRLFDKFDIEKYAASMGIDLQNMDYLNGTKDCSSSLFDEEIMAEKKQFTLSNLTPSAFEKHMGFGALSFGLSEEPYFTLRLMASREHLISLIETRFHIYNRDDALRALASLVGGYNAKKYDEKLIRLKNSDLNLSEEGYLARYNRMMCGAKDFLNIPSERTNRCETTFGCDVEMIGYLSRILYNLKLLSEEETFDFLTCAADLAKTHFSCWEDYFISVLMGWGLSHGVFVEPFLVLADLMAENSAFFIKNPICGY